MDTIQQRNNSIIPTTVDVKHELMRQLLMSPGCCYPVRELTRNRIDRQIVSASLASEAVSDLEKKGLGVSENVKIGRTKPVNIFYKCLPNRADDSCLRQLGIYSEWYAQQFCLPLSSALKVDPKVAEFHPMHHEFPGSFNKSAADDGNSEQQDSKVDDHVNQYGNHCTVSKTRNNCLYQCHNSELF